MVCWLKLISFRISFCSRPVDDNGELVHLSVSSVNNKVLSVCLVSNLAPVAI